MPKRNIPTQYYLFGGAILLLVLVVFITTYSGGKKTEQTDPVVSQGVSYLQTLENKDPNVVDNVLREFRAERLAKERQERVEELTNGVVNVWSLFEDYMLLGDSRSVGFEVYDYLPENRVLAENGATILAIPDLLEEVKQMNPANIFLCYGINDVYGGMWTSGAQYAADYLEAVQSIRSELPDSTIFISSIMPVTEPAVSSSARWAMIPEFNQEIRKMCQENGIFYVDNDAISDTHSDLMEGDGIHFNRAFYIYWATNLMIAVYDASVAQEEAEFS